MKKILFILLAGIGFILNSCREDGDWGNDQTDSQFTYTIDRDKDFSEKAVGEVTELKFNIKSNYDYSTIPMVLKYTGDLDGILKLGDVILEQNKEYDLVNPNNVLRYTGNTSGTHNLKISTKNSKGNTDTQEFALKYAVSDFQVSFSGGSGDYYQGQDVTYQGKITPAKNTDTKGYTIKFNTFNGKVKFNGVDASLGQEYSINDLNNLNVTLNSSVVGTQKLTYTIKNTTVSRDLELIANVKPRQLTIESMSVQPTSVAPNTQISLVGIIKKLPIKDNNNIKYKTWISSATDNNVNGIVTTNNAYVEYPLSENGNISLSMLAKDAGKYTLNFQAQDEFGNVSETKQFEIVVEAPIEFVGEASASFNFVFSIKSSLNPTIKVDLRTWHKNFVARSGAGNKIVKVEYNLKYTYSNRNFEHNFSDIIDSQTEIKVNDDGATVGSIGEWKVQDFVAQGTGVLTIKITTDKGVVLSKSINATINSVKD